MRHSVLCSVLLFLSLLSRTCMMVLASIYLSVSASLPSTANIKPVEVWLLFNLAFPLLVIIVNVLLQVSSVCVCIPLE